jgi:chromosomal replication initiator protein
MRKVLTAQQILQIVADYYETTIERMLSCNRKHTNTLPRQIAMFMMRYNTRMNYFQIGSALQGKRPKPYHHTTVLHSISKVFDLLETDDIYESQIEAIQSNINALMRGSKTRPKQIVKPEEKTIARVVDMSEHEKLIAKYV